MNIFSFIRAQFVALLMVGVCLSSLLVLPMKVHASDNSSALQAQIQQLLQQVYNLQVQLSTMQNSGITVFHSPLLAVNMRVQTTAPLSVRVGPGSSVLLVGTQQAYATGVIVEGPVDQNGYVWWKVAYHNGITGWSAGNWLQSTESVPPASQSIASCVITTDKTSYILGEEVSINWSTTNAKSVQFVKSEKDSFALPSASQKSSDSIEVEANVLGLPRIELKVTDAQGLSNICSRTVAVIGDSVELRINGSALNSYTMNADDRATFAYYPKGDIKMCSVFTIYNGGSSKDPYYAVVHPWNKFVQGTGANDYGVRQVSATGVYPQTNLESVKVECTTRNSGTVSDSISIDVPEGIRDSYSIELNGREINTGTSVTKTDALSLCSKAINDQQYSPSLKYNDVVDCYWGGELLKHVDGWKG